MSNSSVPVGDTGDFLQTYLNTVNGALVHSEAVTPTDKDGVPFTSANPFPVTDSRLPAALDADGGLKSHIQNFPATQAVTGPLTDTQLRASAVPVSGPLTDAQLRASAVTVNDRDREALSGLSFNITLGAGATHATSWVDISSVKWLDFIAELQSSGAFLGTAETTNAADPNTTPPGSGDIVNALAQTIGGTAYGSASNVLTFGGPAQMTWCRVVITSLTGSSQSVKLAAYARYITPTGYQFPLQADMTGDMRAPVVQSAIRGFDPSLHFRSMRFSGFVASQSSTTTIAAGNSFIGSAWVDITGFIGIAVFLKSNANTITAGVILQYSFDGGTTVHAEDPRTYNAAPDGAFYKWSLSTPGQCHVRIKVTAGGSDMTNLRLVTCLLAHETEDVSQRLTEVPTAEMVGDVTKTQLIALKPDGTGVNIAATVAGNLGFAVVEHTVATPIKALSGGGQARVVTVGTTAVRVDASPLANRVGLCVEADEDNTASVFYGYSDAVTTSTGFRMSPGKSREWDHDESTGLWFISTATSQKVYVDEVADTV